MIVTFSLSNVAVHPASHNAPIEISELCCNPGRTYAFFASCGKDGKSNSPLPTVCNLAPFGRVTENAGSCLCREIFVISVAALINVAEAPVSAMAQYGAE